MLKRIRQHTSYRRRKTEGIRSNIREKSLLSCKDMLFAQRKIMIAREVRQVLEFSDELTISVSEEDETGNDSDNRGSLNYGTINY